MATVYSLICWGGRTGKTVSISATTDVVTLTNHGLRNGTKLWPSGTLPAELNTSTPVYARSTGANTFTLHTSSAGAIANTGQITFAGSSTYASVVLKSDLVSSPSTALSAYGLSDLTRWGSSGSERIYDGLSAWRSARFSAAQAVDTEVCEIGEAFTDTISATITMTIPAAGVNVKPEINDIKTPAFHAGVYGDGFRAEFTVSFGSAFGFSGFRHSVEGISISMIGSSCTAVLLQGQYNAIRQCFIYANSTSNGFVGVSSSGSANEVVNNVMLMMTSGIVPATFVTTGNYHVGNTIVKCANGITGGSIAGFFYNNVCVGNSTANWGTTTSINGGGYNAGPAGSTPFYSGATDTSIKTATADNSTFKDYANNDFRPAGDSTAHTSSSPLVDAGVELSSTPAQDMKYGLRPSYKNGSSTYWDVGAFEFDWGYGLPPITVTFNNLQSGSTVRIFSTGTQTVIASTTSSGTTYTPSGVGAETVDYTIYKDGYLPIRVIGVTLYDGLNIDGSQTIDRAYQTSSGLTYGTTATINTGTSRFTLTSGTTGQNWYSFWIEQFRSNAALYNVAFPLQANGPNSFTLKNGYEFSAGLSYITRDGIRYTDSSGVMTAAYAALLSVGVPAGLQVRYEQTDGGTLSDASNTGNIDQLIQVYGDASHGNFDRRSWLTMKVQAEGYDQAEVDVVAQYGTLEDQLYVIALNPQSNSVAAGNPTVSSVTITDHGASPVTWNSKVFSITIIDSGTTPGLDIIQWIRHALAAGGTFQGKDGFNWHDLVQKNGTKYKGVRGILYGDVGASLKGVRILRGTDPHPDFTLHTADDGTTVDTTPAEAATGSVSGIVSGSRLQVYNVTTATEMYNAVVGGTTYSTSYNNGTGYTAGDVVRVRLTYCSGTTAKLPAEYFTIAASGGWSVLASQENDTVYIDNGIDGSTVTEYLSDYVNVQIDISDPDNTTTIQRGYAWYCYQMTLIDGIRYFFDAFIAEDAYNYLLNTDVADIKVQNTGASGVTLTGGALRRKDGSSPIASGGSVYMYYGRAYSDVVTVTGSNVVTGDLADIAPAVWGHGTRTLTSGGGGGASADDVWNHSKALSVGKFLGLK